MLLNVVIVILIIGTLAIISLVWWAILQTRPPRPPPEPRQKGQGHRETPPMPTGAGRLELTRGNGASQLISLPVRGMVSLGRESDNQVVIDEPGVSRYHARLVYEGDGWYVQDQGSANGTLLNSRPVTQALVRPGDMIEIGAARLRLVTEDSAPGRPRATPDPSRSPFIVLRLLGEGGISRVLLARDNRRSGRLVALKVLTRAGGYLLEKFRQEGMLGLDHPHIARVFDTGEISGQPYIALEYVAGPSLRRLLDAGPLTVDEALAVIGQVLAALGYAHRQQIIHRDIKPENIMVAPDEGVKLIDFGIARILAADTRTSHLVTGTPQYMSYEQAVGRPVDQTSDLYAAAIVLYEMLTTTTPFSGETAIEIVRQHQQLLPLPARRLNSDIPIRVDSAIQRALAKDPAQRFRDAAEFAAALGCPPDGPLPPALRDRAARLVEPITG